MDKKQSKVMTKELDEQSHKVAMQAVSIVNRLDNLRVSLVDLAYRGKKLTETQKVALRSLMIDVLQCKSEQVEFVRMMDKAQGRRDL